MVATDDKSKVFGFYPGEIIYCCRTGLSTEEVKESLKYDEWIKKGYVLFI